MLLQQHLPFTVLKRENWKRNIFFHHVATALTVYGIETQKRASYLLVRITYVVATALTVYGIET